MTDTKMTPERLAEIRDLLKYESSIAFYSHRAKESVLLLVEEAEAAAKLRAEYLELAKDSKLLAALYAAGVDNWDGYDDAIQAVTA